MTICMAASPTCCTDRESSYAYDAHHNTCYKKTAHLPALIQLPSTFTNSMIMRKNNNTSSMLESHPLLYILNDQTSKLKIKTVLVPQENRKKRTGLDKFYS
ncbi:hypothetical protein LOTGIDRAFT_153792 [Lottia gigantea]|uniref:Uncharacterized protein n=1 Tax=Lottia gigantea TaxID=225164 RepID=V4A8L2_LOTGI|nr:hypothetical protein LOTGIDRAFT_153792 [Lottia gigantea]ESO91355.1 hypothetical protein LOTGIDRAFT_153792 [Lottia gigantea]